MKIFISGICGVLGSTLAKHFIDKGYKVSGNDKVRIEEAWRLEGYKDKISYLWKSSMDLTWDDFFIGTLKEDGGFADVVIDCALESADRPFGIYSPRQTLIGNLFVPLGVLEAIKNISKDYTPIIIYPSSFNVFYGHKYGTILSESVPPKTSSLYGWTKLAAEELYMAYYKAYGIPIIITRVGSAFGPTMRSDELVGRLIIHCLLNKDFRLRSPKAKRLWCYTQDVIDFYDKLIPTSKKYIGQILHCGGNLNDEIVENWQLAERIKELTDSDISIEPTDYEPGEMIDGKPIDFKVDSSYTKRLLKWEPKYSLNEGLKETVEWFKKNLWRYSVR